MGDTNEISKGCLTHYDNRHIQVRLDFLGLCVYDKDLFDEKRKEEPNQECMAKILRLFETLTDHARTGWQLKAINAKEKGLTVPQEPKEYRFELTNGAIISLIYNTFGESTVRNSLDYLIHLGYIGRYQEKKNSIPVYWLNTQKLQPLLKEQAENELSGFEITPQTTKGLKSHPKRPKSNPSPTISNPSTPKSDTSGFESTDNNISNNKDNITEKERNERESTPNIPDTHTFVSSDTARALASSGEIDEAMIREVISELGEPVSEELIQRTIDAIKQGVIVQRRYIREQIGLPSDIHPQQGDDHASVASGHSHRVGDAAACGDTTSHPAVDSGQVATPEARPVLETQEINDEGDDHASRVPTVPATDTPAPSERHVSWPGSDHSRDITYPDNGLSAVHPMGIGTASGVGSREADVQRPVGKDGTAQVAETPTTPMPAQSLSSPQAEQAALGQSPKGKGKKQAEPKPETPKGPPVEPPADMAWGTRKCLMWFDFWRGGSLIGKWKLMQASTCAKGMAEQFDEQTVIQARTDMEADPYYISKGGCDVCDVANNIHKYLKRRQSKQQPAIQPVLKVVKRYSSYDDPNFRSDQDFYPVEGGSYATASR